MTAPGGRVERKLAAIFAADVAGYFRLVGSDEVGTLHLLAARRETMDRLIAEHGGRIANTAGDSILAEFPSAVDAIQCAVEAQARLAAANRDLPADRRLEFRIGVNLGDVWSRTATSRRRGEHRRPAREPRRSGRRRRLGHRLRPPPRASSTAASPISAHGGSRTSSGRCGPTAAPMALGDGCRRRIPRRRPCPTSPPSPSCRSRT